MKIDNITTKVRDLINNSLELDISCINIYQYKTKEISFPSTSNPYLFLVLDGDIRLHTISGILDYSKGSYSISSIDMPKSCYALSFSNNNDILALTIEFTVTEIISVILDLDDELINKIIKEELSDEVMEKSDNRVIMTIDKLISLVNDKDILKYMEKHLRKEIIFYILCGSQGKKLIQSITNLSSLDDIYEVNNYIKNNYKSSFNTKDLAYKTNMSVSNFHKKFKQAVGMGPLQCQKRLRLTEARRLMIDEKFSVTEASLEVGYESVSQFINDYKKMFNRTPKEDIQVLTDK